MMKRRPDVLALAVVIAAVAVVTLAAPNADKTSRTVDWKAVAASGRVESRGSDEAAAWLAVHRGDHVGGTSLVRTGSRSRATFVQGAKIVLLDPDSQVMLPTLASAAGPQSVFQSSGSVVYQVDGVRETGFRVETPYLVAGVKGTEFLVSVENGRASVTVREGQVEITTARSGERHFVGAGETILVHEDAATGGIERVDRRGMSPDGTSALGELRHLAWKQSRRLDEAQREVSFLIGGRERNRAHELDLAAVKPELDRAPAEDPTVTLQLERTLDAPILETSDELIQDLTNDPKLATPAPAPSP
jgi:FecR-like protein